MRERAFWVLKHRSNTLRLKFISETTVSVGGRIVEHKVILSTAWAERRGHSDEDLDNLFGLRLAEARDCSEAHACPKCGSEQEDSNYQFFVYEPRVEVDETSGIRYVGCVCGTVYRSGFRNTRTRFTFDE
jgi:hypothetical protein